jgi:hypothetical protein
MRIHNAGLTPEPFLDVAGSDKLFYSFDKELTAPRSLSGDIRGENIYRNHAKYISELKSSAYIPYKQPEQHVATCALTQLADPQNGGMPRGGIDVSAWAQSVTNVAGVKPDVLKDAAHVPHPNPYFARWFYYREYVRSLEKCSFVWLTDGTDVTMLRNPFPSMQWGKLYAGDEQGQTLQTEWMRKYHYHDFYNGMFDTQFPLLNAGICGGDRNTVLEFCELMCERSGLDGQMTDMAMFNYTAYIDFRGRFLHGPQVNTVFKSYTPTEAAWWMHK